ncbi:hypothetical protein [Pseudomonas glycinae]|uniref:hypothetical protein n=1 Tax=Pseudomonas glycinae TaxID=1785145 RepID=UPI001F3D2730|nr:hypothetical protein [Pseudomonas glycinae]
MNKTDFEYDADLFASKINKTRWALKGAQTRLLERVEHWEELGTQYLGGAISISALPEENRIEGQVFGKKFAIHYGPLGREESGVLEAVLLNYSLVAGDPVVISHFLVTPDGSILAASGDLIIDVNAPSFSFRFMIAIVNRVLNTSAEN